MLQKKRSFALHFTYFHKKYFSLIGSCVQYQNNLITIFVILYFIKQLNLLFSDKHIFYIRLYFQGRMLYHIIRHCFLKFLMSFFKTLNSFAVHLMLRKSIISSSDILAVSEIVIFIFGRIVRSTHHQSVPEFFCFYNCFYSAP